MSACFFLTFASGQDAAIEAVFTLPAETAKATRQNVCETVFKALGIRGEEQRSLSEEKQTNEPYNWSSLLP